MEAPVQEGLRLKTNFPMKSSQHGKRHQGTEAMLRKDFYPNTAALAELSGEEEGDVEFNTCPQR